MSGQQESIDAAARAQHTHPQMLGDAVSHSARGIDPLLMSGDYVRQTEDNVTHINDIVIIDDGRPMQGGKLDLACEMCNLVYERLGAGISTQEAMNMLLLTQRMLNVTMAQAHRETGTPFIQASIAETYAAIATLTDDGKSKVTDDTLRQIMVAAKDLEFNYPPGVTHSRGMGSADAEMLALAARLQEKPVVPLNVPKIFQQRNNHRFNDQPHAERFSQKLEQRNRNMKIAVSSKLSKAQQKKLKRKEDKDIAARLKAYHRRVRGGTAG